MITLMTKQFSKWASKQNIPENELVTAISEVQDGIFEANLGGYLYKKRIRFKGQGKSGSARTVVCHKKDDRSIFIHGFAKNEKDNLAIKEFHAFKEFSKILLNLPLESIWVAIENGDFVEVRS
jgi:hypothetical protein